MSNAVQLQMNTGVALTVRVFHKTETVRGVDYFVGYEVEEIAGLPKPRYALYTRGDVSDYLYDAGAPLHDIVYDLNEEDLELVVL